MELYEKLGVFYLGKETEPETKQRLDDYLLYDSRDLTTHAVCVGMTGSGKTGLCIGLLEEAAIDGIPAIVIDPKGDMANLMLTFPNMLPEDFQPWINPEEAARKGQSEAEFAAAEARLWQQGLAEWDQQPSRIANMLARTDIQLYTPGSLAGKPLSIVQLFELPQQAVLNDPESLNNLVSGTSASLLGLLGIEADPIRSRENILLANILLTAWQSGQALNLAELIQRIQRPPFNQIGVMDLESFYPEKERFALAMQFNNLLAAPGFAAWMQGEPLEIDRLLYNDAGKPQISILSIAHLSEAERMFFVSLLLNQVVSWVRTQPGTSSLRAILYMDEIFGYFPPTANPPSKAPLLTLLKQARAYGLGVMLTTQNPMDLDYKGMANMGTWFIGRLQTERDKARLLDGLEGASNASGQAFNRAEMDRLISGLGKRVFLMNNVHESEPTLFETRWCLSYLRGPLTRNEIARLPGAGQTAPVAAASTPSPAGAAVPVTAAAATLAGSVAAADAPSPAAAQVPVLPTNQTVAARPQLPADVPQVWLPSRGSTDGLVYRPALLGVVETYYLDKASGHAQTVSETYLTPVQDSLMPVHWPDAQLLDVDLAALSHDAEADLPYEKLADAALKKTSYTAWGRDLVDHIFRHAALELFRNEKLKATSYPGESERDFRIRLQQIFREKRDAEIEKMRAKYATRIRTMTERVRRAEQALQREKDQAKDAKTQTAISIGTTILGSLFGRSKVSVGNLGRAATSARSVSRSARQSGDVSRSEETLDTYRQQLAELEAEMTTEIDAFQAEFEAQATEIQTVAVKPLKSNIQLKTLALVWEPVRLQAAGQAEAAW